MSGPLPEALDGTSCGSTSDLGATTVPLRTSYGESGTCAGVVALLDHDPVAAEPAGVSARDALVGALR